MCKPITSSGLKPTTLDLLYQDDEVKLSVLVMPILTDYWEPALKEESNVVPLVSRLEHRADLHYAGYSMTGKGNIKTIKMCLGTCRGPVFLARGGFPLELSTSRIKFLPKKEASVTSADLRPVSIASVVVRYRHKILAESIRETNFVDLQQRCLANDCAKDITVTRILDEIF